MNIRTIALVLVAVVAMGCSGEQHDEESSNKCAVGLTFEGVTYVPTTQAPSTPSTVGTRIGDATWMACNDSGGTEDSSSEEGGPQAVFSLTGVERKYAVAVQDSPSSYRVLVASGGEIPDHVSAKLGMGN